jgi:hypothetical protein
VTERLIVIVAGRLALAALLFLAQASIGVADNTPGSLLRLEIKQVSGKSGMTTRSIELTHGGEILERAKSGAIRRARLLPSQRRKLEALALQLAERDASKCGPTIGADLDGFEVHVEYARTTIHFFVPVHCPSQSIAKRLVALAVSIASRQLRLRGDSDSWPDSVPEPLGLRHIDAALSKAAFALTMP